MNSAGGLQLVRNLRIMVEIFIVWNGTKLLFDEI